MFVLKMKFLSLAVQKLSSEQTDRQTDRQTQMKLLPTTYADGKNYNNMVAQLYLFSISVQFLIHFIFGSN